VPRSRSRRDWVVSISAIAATIVAAEILNRLQAHWYAYAMFLVSIWVLLIVYYRDRLRPSR